MKKAENGLFVSVNYKGTLENGEVFDSSYGRQPLEVHMGAGQLIVGFERELLGMALNETKVFTLDPQDAYGSRNEKLVHVVDRSEFPEHMTPQVGMTIGLQDPGGHPIPAQISEVDDQSVTLDLNHPLAGKSLTFEIEVVGISNEQTQKPSGCGAGCDCSSDSC